jgi:hypothetical protein
MFDLNNSKSKGFIEKIVSIFADIEVEERKSDRGISVADTPDNNVHQPFAMMQAGGYGPYKRYVNYEEATKGTKLRIYRQMVEYPEIGYALETLVNEIVNPDEDTGDVVKMDILNEDLVNHVNKRIILRKHWDYVVNDLMGIHKDAHEVIKSFLTLGEVAYEKVQNPNKPQEGLKRIRRLSVDNTFPIYDRDGNISGFQLGAASAGEKLIVPKETIAYARYGEIAYNQDTGERVALSYLEKVKKVWRQLQLLEEAVLIYRIVRAPERRIWKIATGNMPRSQAVQYVEKLKSEYRQRKTYNQVTGEVGGQANVLNMLEDFWFSQPDTGNSSDVQTLDGGCLTLDTKVCLLDGRNLEMREIIKEKEEGKSLWTYSCNPDTGKIVPGEITHAHITNKNARVMRITLDNGKTVVCTLNHKWPTWNKGMVEAQELEVGDSFISFDKKYEKIKGADNEYEMVYDHESNKWVYTHRLVAEYMREFSEENRMMYEDHNDKFNTVHHKDYNRYNNTPENLAWMNFKDHFKYHSDTRGQYGKHANEIFQEMMKDDHFKKWYKDRQKEGIKNMSEDTEFRNSVLEKRGKSISYTKSDPRRKQVYSRNTKKLHESKEYQRKVFGPQTITFNNKILKIVIDTYKEGCIGYKELLVNLNESEEFKTAMLEENGKVKRYKGTFKHHHLKNLLLKYNYRSFRDFTEKVEHFNHKIAKIEYLEETQVVANLTVDSEEKYHGYHTYALEIGVFTKNSNLGEIRDLDYFLKKLYLGLRIPENKRLETQMGQPNFNVGDVGEINHQEVMFTKMATRISMQIQDMIFDIYKTHLKLTGLWKQYNLKDRDFKIYFKRNTYFEELKQAKLEETRLNLWGTVASFIGEIFSREYAVKKYLHISEEEWNENERLLEKEKQESQTDQGQGIMGGF